MSTRSARPRLPAFVLITALATQALSCAQPPTPPPTTQPATTRPATTRPAAAAPGRDCIRVGTWNLEQFGFREPLRTEADYQKIAAFIVRIGVDVLAVQEVNGAPPLRRLRRHLGKDWQFAVGKSGGFRGQDTRISVGFLWNTRRVKLRQCEEMLEFERRSGGQPIFHRLPVCAVFQARRRDGTAGLDFRILTTHMKAGRGTRNEQKRRGEVMGIKKFLQALRETANEDQDILVVGDFNHTYGAPGHQEFIKDKAVRYLRGKTDTPTILHFDDPIDQIAVCPGLEEEVVRGSFRVHTTLLDSGLDRDSWRASYSDHFPVTVDLSASRDRDPGAWFTAPAHPLGVGGAAAKANGSSPFVAGVNVEVRLAADHPDAPLTRGKLLAAPDRWVQLRLASGVQRSYPADKVLDITIIR
ncbi:MAG: endonuclease/exonuclease/phosphatase family protein [Planctomycetota bacterium]|jgi:endonuclease/exonuclease/phosphatase family metal-dependent hydrolase